MHKCAAAKRFPRASRNRCAEASAAVIKNATDFLEMRTSPRDSREPPASALSCVGTADEYARPRMELRHLRYFIAVAEEENVSRAALKLHVSQPALSRQIRDLEDELGFLLLQRGAKSVRLTEAGRAFLTEARAVLQR